MYLTNINEQQQIQKHTYYFMNLFLEIQTHEISITADILNNI